MMTTPITDRANWQLTGICLLIGASVLFHSETRPLAAADTADVEADKQLQADVDRLIELQKAGKDTADYDKKTAAKRMDAWRRAAERGSAVGQFLLGRALDIGTSVPKDEKAAVDWYRKSATQGYAPAQRNLGAAVSLAAEWEKTRRSELNGFGRQRTKIIALLKLSLPNAISKGAALIKSQRPVLSGCARQPKKAGARRKAALAIASSKELDVFRM